MARPLRTKDPEIYRLITIRTVEARLWITPSRKVQRLLGGVLARYQEIFGIELYAYAFLGNHIHLVARAPQQNMDEFEENINREFARRLNWKHRREGPLWARRYDDQQILSEGDLLNAFLYVNTNPTKHGLVRNSRDWPGLISFQHCVDEEDRKFFFHRRSKDGWGSSDTEHSLKLSVLPQFRKYSKQQRQKIILDLLKKRMKQLASERASRNEGFLGVKKIREQRAGDRPREVAKSIRPSCYTSCAKLRAQFKRERKDLLEAYARASVRFRLGARHVVFPPYTFLPPTHRLPRILPFRPLLRDAPLDAA